MAEPLIRLIMPKAPGEPVIMADATLETTEIGRIAIPPDQWRKFIEKAKAGELDLPEGV
jgi:hypothetical protein